MSSRARWGALLLAGTLACAPREAAQAAVAAPDSILRLEWLERAVLEQNASLAAGKAALTAAQARASAGGALADPMLDVMSAPRSWSSNAVDPAYRVGLTQKLPWFGQRSALRREAESDARATGYDLESLRLDLLAETRAAYYDWYHVANQLGANHEQVALLEQLHAVALARYAAGTAEKTDALQAEVERATLEHEQVVLERDRRVLAARLNALLHRPQGTPVPPPPADLEAPDSLTAADVARARAHGEWPELDAAGARADAWRAKLEGAARARWPETEVTVAYDRFWMEPELQGTVGVSLSLPLGLGRIGDTEREARAGIAAAEAERAAARDRIEQRVAVALAMAEESRHEVEIMEREVLPASERAYDALRAGYTTGRVPFATLLLGARDAARARLDVHRARAARHQAEAELRRALASDMNALQEVP